MSQAEQGLILRPMSLADVPAVYEIDARSYTLPWSERAYRYEISQNSSARLWVAELPGEQGDLLVVGMVVTWIILDEAHIGTIATHPQYRRRGVAQALMRQALRDARQQGAQQALLEVRRSNLAAQALYHKLGFKITGVRPRYYQDNQEDALLMNLQTLEAFE